jgi:hypothetical protein
MPVVRDNPIRRQGDQSPTCLRGHAGPVNWATDFGTPVPDHDKCIGRHLRSVVDSILASAATKARGPRRERTENFMKIGSGTGGILTYAASRSSTTGKCRLPST